jgi:hypothetical protein
LQERLHLRFSVGINYWILLDPPYGSPAAGKIAGTISSFPLQACSKKGGRTMSKKLKNIIFTGMAAAVLCAGSVSARQLSLNVQDTTCQHHFCTRTQPCPNVLGCGCVFNNPNATSGVCGFIAAKPAK